MTGTSALPLDMRSVSYRYAGSVSPVLHDVSLSVARGETLGIAGPNDAGKSTLCLVAAGLAPSVIGGRLEGEVLLGGQPTTRLRPHEAAGRCGILFQSSETQLSGTAPTVWEEVAFGPRNLGLDVAEIVERVDEALDETGIRDLEAREPRHLSGGQAQLVALASVLALRPPVLVLDEPTSLLDPIGTQLVGNALARLARREGTAIVLVEHKANLLLRLADRVVILDAGRIALEGPARRVLADERLPALGVDPPESIAIERLARAAGVGARLDPAALERAERTTWDAAAGRLAAGVAPVEAAAVARPGVTFEHPAASVTALEFTYPDGTLALAGLDLSIATGTSLAIVGQNGSGKSTLVRHLNGLLRPTRGAVEVLGQPTAGVHVAALARHVGLAFQNPDRQIFAGRARDEVAFGPRNLGRSRREVDSSVGDALEEVGLASASETNPFDLGFSSRKLLTIASILAMRTPIVVLDEPTTGQDARGAARIGSIVERLVAEGRTVVTISHDMRFVAERFERVVVMRRGRIVLDGPPEEVFARPAWPALESAHLDPPVAARLAHELGLGSTPTAEQVVAALAGRQDD